MSSVYCPWRSGSSRSLCYPPGRRGRRYFSHARGDGLGVTLARIRTIKPEFFTHAKICRLTPLARLFYVSLWCEADRLGRLKWNPDTLKYRYLPADDCGIEALGAELVTAGLIRLYETPTQIYADIPGFLEHQVINNRESDSSLPAFLDDACMTRESGVRDAACGKEGRKGREGKEGTATRVRSEGEDFLAFWEAYPEKVGRKAAEKAWAAATDKPDLQTILIAVEAYKRVKPDDRIWMNPATWISDARWSDVPFAGLPATPDAPVVDSQWGPRLAGWHARKFWMTNWGPRPDQSDCQAPKHFLAKPNGSASSSPV